MYTPPHLPDTQSLTDFRENAAASLRRLRKSDKPLLLTQNGKAAGIVMSTKVYEQLAAAADMADSIARLHESTDQMKSGKGRPADQYFAELKAKLSASRPKKGRR